MKQSEEMMILKSSLSLESTLGISVGSPTLGSTLTLTSPSPSPSLSLTSPSLTPEIAPFQNHENRILPISISKAISTFSTFSRLSLRGNNLLMTTVVYYCLVLNDVTVGY